MSRTDDSHPPPASADADGLGVSPRLALAATLGVVVLVYLPILGFDFIYDDGWTLVANGFLRHPEDLGKLLGPEAYAAQVPDAFRPTSVAFDVLTYQVLGLSAALHHALSLSMHVGVCGLLAMWLRRRGAPTTVAVGSAFVFGVLGLHAEPVSVVSFREDLLAGALGVGALVLADTAATARGARAWAAGVAAVLAMAFAGGAKASAVGLAPLWLLMHGLRPWPAPSPSRRRLVAVGLALLVGAAAPVALRVVIFDGLSPYGADNPAVMAHRVGTGPVLAASMQIHLAYLWQLIVPTGLSPEYVDFAARWSDPATLLATGALGGLVGWTLTTVRRRPRLAFAVLGSALLALPTSNLFPMPNMRADRLMYLPSLPACVGTTVLALAIGRTLAARWRRPRWRWAPLLALVVVQGATARAASNTYRSDRRLWEIGLRRAPGSARAHAVLGELLLARYVDTGASDPVILGRARTHCRLARWHDPFDPLAWLCEGRRAVVERDHLRAYRSFERALALAHQRRASIEIAMAPSLLARTDLPFATRSARAIALVARLATEAPYSAEVARVAADLHHRLGHAERALAEYERASSLRPERWDLVARRVELQLDLGHSTAAAAALGAPSSETYTGVDPALRSELLRRLAMAQRLWPTSDPTD